MIFVLVLLTVHAVLNVVNLITSKDTIYRVAAFVDVCCSGFAAYTVYRALV